MTAAKKGEATSKQTRNKGRASPQKNVTMTQEYWDRLEAIREAAPGGLDRSGTIRYLIDLEWKRLEREKSRRKPAE